MKGILGRPLRKTGLNVLVHAVSTCFLWVRFRKIKSMDLQPPGFSRDVLGLVARYGVISTGDDHKSLRKTMNPAFSVSNLMKHTCTTSPSTAP
ncbi:hypothetical protein B0H12DRAFT_1155056 [Mycena haematopus]|nr:hypothetical protein B0H12DRAFT_1155056 [Mycena haematopus]